MRKRRLNCSLSPASQQAHTHTAAEFGIEGFFEIPTGTASMHCKYPKVAVSVHYKSRMRINSYELCKSIFRHFQMSDFVNEDHRGRVDYTYDE